MNTARNPSVPGAYEKEQLREIARWKQQEPSVVFRLLHKGLSPAAWLMQRVVPTAAIRKVLHFSSSAAEWLTDTADILRDAGVSRVADLRKHDLEKSDWLANGVHNRAIGIASAEGVATGAAGVFGLAADVPAIIVIALRTIHKIGVCYGFEADGTRDRDFVLAILAVSGANSLQEKLSALDAMRAIEARATTKAMAVIGVNNLARQLALNLAKRKALQAIPAVGAVIGGSVNAWYIREVGWAARRAFQERWLVERYGKSIWQESADR